MLNKIKQKQWLILLAAVLLIMTFLYFQKISTKTDLNKILHSPNQVIEKTNKSKDNKINSVTYDSTPPQNFVKTYQGSQPDGAIHLDENGNVILDKDLKRLFDYYLAAIGELPLDQMRKYLQKFAGEQLNPDQLQQLLGYFDKYHDYLTQADLFAQRTGDELSLQEKMTLLTEFRADSLGHEMANAFFADEQNYIEFVLTDKHNDELDQEQLEWLQAENQATEFQDIVIENREFNAAGTIESAEVYQYRVEQYGQEAADRLSLLDQQRAQWQTVVDDYFVQRQHIQNQQGNISLEQLNAGYTPEEIRRLEALWRIENQSP